jgi:hypothetical protein
VAKVLFAWRTRFGSREIAASSPRVAAGGMPSAVVLAFCAKQRDRRNQSITGDA